MPTNIFSPLLPLAVKIAFFSVIFTFIEFNMFSLKVSFLSRPLLKKKRSSLGKPKDIWCPVT